MLKIAKAMKIQCSCGAKFAFEPAPEMRANPVHFVCPSCQTDISQHLDAIVRQEFPDGATANAPAAPGEQARIVSAPVMIEAPAQAAAPALRVRRDSSPKPATAEETLPVNSGPQPCPRHLDQLATASCFICHKPICQKCLMLFGYLCGPLCKAKANSHGIEVPVFEGQRDFVEARRWRKVVRLSWAAALVIILFLGVWTWYVWFGSSPKQIFSVRFPAPALSGQSAVAGKNQIVFLHGDTLARYDMGQNKEIWSRALMDPVLIADQVNNEVKSIQKSIDVANNEGWERVPKMPSREKLTRQAERAAAAAMELKVRAKNVWVATPGKLSRYDFATGKLVSEVPIKSRYGGLIAMGDELMVVDVDSGKPTASRVNLLTGESKEEVIGQSSLNLAGEPSATGPADQPVPGPKQALAGLPTGMPGKDRDKALDPKKVAKQAQNLSYPARIALPAVLAGNMNQERALNEMDEQGKPKPATAATRKSQDNVSIIPTPEGFQEFSVRLVESKMIAKNAMKAAPAKSVLDGDLTVTKTTDAANEILNEMQRARGGDVVYEDQSRYQVTIRRSDGQGEWTGEVIAYPHLFPLKTVNVLTSSKSIIVFDKSNRKLWQSQLGYDVHGSMGALSEENAPYGLGPCAEKNRMLYVFDEAVLTAFDLSSGAVKWRLPSVGISGLFFDEKGMIYVNTTTASPETIRYSRQIDIGARASAVVMKIDSESGKTLWTAEPGGLINYVSGKNIFVVQSFLPEEEDEDNPYQVDSGFDKPPYLRIKRINPKNGREMWEHFQQRGPLDIQFEKNTIRLVFKKEVQVLRFFSL